MINKEIDHSHRSYELPPVGNNPSSTAAGTAPASFARPPGIAPGKLGRWTFASPDTPGMPEPSDKTAWDFIHFRGFLDYQMYMQFSWHGCDSILAAPLVLDMIRLAHMALVR